MVLGLGRGAGALWGCRVGLGASALFGGGSGLVGRGLHFRTGFTRGCARGVGGGLRGLFTGAWGEALRCGFGERSSAATCSRLRGLVCHMLLRLLDEEGCDGCPLVFGVGAPPVLEDLDGLVEPLLLDEGGAILPAVVFGASLAVLLKLGGGLFADKVVGGGLAGGDEDGLLARGGFGVVVDHLQRVGAGVELDACIGRPQTAVATVDNELARGVRMDDDGALAGGRRGLRGVAVDVPLRERSIGRGAGEQERGKEEGEERSHEDTLAWRTESRRTASRRWRRLQNDGVPARPCCGLSRA